MEVFSLPRITHISEAIDGSRLDTCLPFTEKKKLSIQAQLIFLAIITGELELSGSEKLTHRILKEVKPLGTTDADANKIYARLCTLAERLGDEMAVVRLLHVTPKQYAYFAPERPLFGEEVNKKFSSTISEIEEAGKCLALSRATACAFHVMRAVEVGLKALTKKLNVQYGKSWEAALRNIREELNLRHKASPAIKGWKKVEPFFNEAFDDLVAFKNAWRNPTMHCERRYREEEAQEVFDRAKTLMRRLATKLKE